MRRPLVEVKDVGQREFHWPQTSFYSIEDYKLKNDLILVFGEEPSMKWKTYSENISNTLLDLGVKRAVTLGAFFGQVAHTLPVLSLVSVMTQLFMQDITFYQQTIQVHRDNKLVMI